jgi:predicted DNA-binding transcriptional regulator AlpA
MEQVFICKGNMQQRLGISRSTVGRWVESGQLPKPVNPSGKPKGRRYWLLSEVEEAERRWRKPETENPDEH